MHSKSKDWERHCRVKSMRELFLAQETAIIFQEAERSLISEPPAYACARAVMAQRGQDESAHGHPLSSTHMCALEAAAHEVAGPQPCGAMIAPGAGVRTLMMHSLRLWSVANVAWQ